MVQLISKSKAQGYLVNYIDQLELVGYTNPGVVRKLLAYTFLLDFVEYMHAFIEEHDYKAIDNALAKLFASGSCLLPYPIFCVRRATLGSAEYMGDLKLRVTEVGMDKRITEDEYLRTA